MNPYGFEARLNGTADRITDHYTGLAVKNSFDLVSELAPFVEGPQPCVDDRGSDYANKAVCTPSHDKTSCIFRVDQEPVRRSFTWFFVSSPESKLKSLCGRLVELFW
ncbi:hypothetical protein TNCV_1508571 [Trichonephila clavipes]|nr:hypothetical protein TNCV_1508571 [Trichonephila clavipes]